MSVRTTIALAAASLLLPVALLRADGPIPTDKEKKPPKKVITEDELRSAGASRGTVSMGTPDAQPSPEAAKDGAAAKGEAAKEEPSESEKRETRRKEIQDGINFESANIKSLQEQVDTAQKELNDLTDIAYSVPGTSTGRRAALLKLIDDANAMIKTSNEKIEKLEDEARHAGIAVSRP
jgi:chromosome segregation ATPase